MTTTITILLAIIAFTSLYRVYSLVRKTNRKQHFKAKKDGTMRMRWDLEFKVAKTRAIREDIRKEYDFMVSRIAAIEDRISQEKGKAEKAKLNDDKVRAEKDKERLLNQMEQLDMEVNGAKPSNENPNGHIGLNEQIESLEELEGMIGSYIK